MQKKKLALIGLLIVGGNFAFSQENQTSLSTAKASRTETVKSSVEERNDVFSPLKPADGTPYVFSSQAELNGAVLKKREVLIEEIKKVQLEPEKANILRQELWRLENAIVKPQ